MAYRMQAMSKRNQNNHRINDTLTGGSLVVACFVEAEGCFTQSWLPLGSSIPASIDYEYGQMRLRSGPPTRYVYKSTS